MSCTCTHEHDWCPECTEKAKRFADNLNQKLRTVTAGDDGVPSPSNESMNEVISRGRDSKSTVPIMKFGPPVTRRPDAPTPTPSAGTNEEFNERLTGKKISSVKDITLHEVPSGDRFSFGN